MFIQNLIHANGIAAKLVSGEADFLRRRKLVGPIPALENFACELKALDERGNPVYEITSGEPTWEGFGRPAAEDLLNEIGETSFVEECQNDVDRVTGALWCREQIAAMHVDSHPDLVKVLVGVDPSGGDGPDNDEQGIIVGGIGTDGLLYITKDVSGSYTPYDWGNTSVTVYLNAMADLIVGEQNYGGDMVKSTVVSAAERMEVKVEYDDVHATRGKVRRFGPVGGLCGSPNKPETWDKSRIKLCGSFPELEEEMRTWTEDSGWSPNRLDGMCWIATYLLLGVQKKKPRAVYRG
jgi:phage terminase large subunit-like protein